MGVLDLIYSVPWPILVVIAVVGFAAVFAHEAREAWDHWGNTNHQSNGGKVAAVVLLGVFAWLLLVAGFATFSLYAFLVVVVAAFWAAFTWSSSASSHSARS